MADSCLEAKKASAAETRALFPTLLKNILDFS